MRRHLNYANVVATLALVFAMSGSALAAKHYLLTKTSQISPKVLKSFSATNTALFKRLSKTVTVSKASSATNATSAAHATVADSATTAGTAATAASATTAGAANSLNGLQIVAGPQLPNPAEKVSTGEVVCPNGTHAISGGVVDNGGIEQSVNETFIDNSSATSHNDEFVGVVNNTSKTTAFTFNVWALCANSSVAGSAIAK